MLQIKDNFDILVNELNFLFYDANNYIKNILDTAKIKTRLRQLTFCDALIYKFMCSYKNITNSQVVSDLNFTNNNKFTTDKSNYYYKEQKIPLTFYQNILLKTKQLFTKYENKNILNKIIAVDGTYNNTNFKKDKNLETTLNMGYYDVTNCIPINIELKNYDTKNKEVESFITYITNNNLDMQNIIFVMDRAYFSYDLFEILNEKKIKFVIRVKNNCVHLNNKHKNKNKKILNDIRFVVYESDVVLIKKDKNNKDRKITQHLACNIATNLDQKYNDEIIKNIYKSRWDVETFFKLLKYNFKFTNLTEHNKETRTCYLKTYTAILINCILERLFELQINSINKETNKYTIKYNKSLAVNGLKKIIPDIINSNLTTDKLLKYLNCYIDPIYCEKNKHNPRTSKRPFTKWYVKAYINLYKYAKIIDCVDNDCISDLNKNLKMEAQTIQINT